MRKWFMGLLVVMVMFAALPAGAEEAGKSRFGQFAFFNPVQVFPEADSVRVIRFNMLYGVNANVSGLDIGTANVVKGKLSGIQLGLFNWVEGDAEAWQSALVNLTDGDFLGFQSGVFNRTKKQCKGAQLGFVNMAGSLHGLQLGILNINESGSKYKKYLPVVNWAF